MIDNHTPNSNTPCGDEKDDVFRILSDKQCRHVLRYFQESTTVVVSVDDLITHLSEHGETIGTREQANIALYHAVFPKLAEAGMIEYDERSVTVRYRGNPLLEAILQRVAEFECGT